MRALIKKELTEVLVPFGLAFVVIALAWLASVRFWDALLPPATDLLVTVASSSALAGAVLGYVQFSAERWRGPFFAASPWLRAGLVSALVIASQIVLQPSLIDYGDKEPTKSQLEVFQMLSSQLDDQLKKWAQVKQEDVAKVSELIKQANLPALIITEKKSG